MNPDSPARISHTHRRAGMAACALLLLPTLAAAQGSADGGALTAEIDWMKELARGGNTGIALFALGFLTITIVVERLVNLRSRRILPPDFSREVMPLWALGRFDEILAACRQCPSTLARMASFLVEHRDAPPDLLIQGASDIGSRELLHEQKRAYGLAVIASLAPLLGLLGTIIGMIESFKLVELYGDEGGASLLAGSISKALITTAMGLIIAIPALGLYHLFRFRVQSLGAQLDEAMERLVNAWLLRKPGA